MLCVCVCVQTNCLEELTRPAPNHQGMAGRSDWVHIYHSVLPVLSLHQVDEGRVAGALRSACAALVAKNNTMFRAAGVAVWETRFRVPGGAWRLLTYCPTGINFVMLTDAPMLIVNSSAKCMYWLSFSVFAGYAWVCSPCSLVCLIIVFSACCCTPVTSRA